MSDSIFANRVDKKKEKFAVFHDRVHAYLWTFVGIKLYYNTKFDRILKSHYAFFQSIKNGCANNLVDPFKLISKAASLVL